MSRAPVSSQRCRRAFINRFDGEIACGKGCVAFTGRQPLQAFTECRGVEAALLFQLLVVRFDARAAGGHRLRGGVDEHGGEARVEAADGDSTAHRAGTDDPDACDRAFDRCGTGARRLARGSIAEECVAKGFGFGRLEQGSKQFALAAGTHWQGFGEREFHRFDAGKLRRQRFFQRRALCIEISLCVLARLKPGRLIADAREWLAH